MENIELNISKTYKDAIIIGDMLSSIWGDNINSSDLDIIFKHINLFPKGHIIAKIGEINVGSSIAFPINKKPPIELFNTKHPYDFISKRGEMYYIHVIQVLPEYRNKGIGSNMLDRQIRVAKEIRCKYVVGYSIDREIKRWEKKGFESFGSLGDYKNFGKVKWIKMLIE